MFWSEPVFAGSILAYGTPLKVEPKIKFIDSNSNLVWDSGEMVVYDNNNNGVYDLGEPIIANGALGDGVWHQGEPVAYDSDSNGIFDSDDSIACAPQPPNLTLLPLHPP